MSDVSSLAPWKFLSRKVLEWRELEMKRDPWQSTLGILKNSEGRSIVHSKEVYNNAWVLRGCPEYSQSKLNVQSLWKLSRDNYDYLFIA